MKDVEMLTTAAGPNHVLLAGKRYTITDEQYEQMKDASPPALRLLSPSAVAELPRKKRPVRPGRPDPGDESKTARGKKAPAKPLTSEVDDDDEDDDEDNEDDEK